MELDTVLSQLQKSYGTLHSTITITKTIWNLTQYYHNYKNHMELDTVLSQLQKWTQVTVT
jgi:hypothetical protein